MQLRGSRSPGASSGAVEGATRLGTQLTKIPRTFAICKYLIAGGRLGMVEALPLIVGEEEQLVLHDGAADGRAKHVPAQLWLFAHSVGFCTSGLGFAAPMVKPFCQVFAFRMSLRKNSKAEP